MYRLSDGSGGRENSQASETGYSSLIPRTFARTQNKGFPNGLRLGHRLVPESTSVTSYGFEPNPQPETTTVNLQKIFRIPEAYLRLITHDAEA